MSGGYLTAYVAGDDWRSMWGLSENTKRSKVFEQVATVLTIIEELLRGFEAMWGQESVSY